MKLTLKIAAGVFLGLFAVMGVLAVLRWRAEAARKQEERANYEFNQQMFRLTPDQWVASVNRLFD